MTAAHKKRRLDTLLVDRGLAPSRTRARSMILAGKVRLDNGIAAKAGTMLSTDTERSMIGDVAFLASVTSFRATRSAMTCSSRRTTARSIRR